MLVTPAVLYKRSSYKVSRKARKLALTLHDLLTKWNRMKCEYDLSNDFFKKLFARFVVLIECVVGRVKSRIPLESILFSRNIYLTENEPQYFIHNRVLIKYYHTD